MADGCVPPDEVKLSARLALLPETLDEESVRARWAISIPGERMMAITTLTLSMGNCLGERPVIRAYDSYVSSLIRGSGEPGVQYSLFGYWRLCLSRAAIG